DLCGQFCEAPEISQVLWGLWAFCLLRAQLERAHEITEDMLRRSERLSYPGLAMRGHLAMEVTLIHRAEFAPAMEHFEKARSLYDANWDRHDSFRYTQNPQVGMQCHAAWALWFLGRPNQALNQMQKALKFARDLSEPHGLAHALYFAAILHQLRREPPLAQECAEGAIAVSNEHGLALYEAHATITRGWALTEQGHQEEGLEQLRQGLAAHRATFTEVQRPHFLSLLAEALARTGHVEEGLDLLEEAVTLVNRNDERYYEAELYRLKAELLLMQSRRRAVSQSASAGKPAVEAEVGAPTQAEGCFRRSIQIARQQNAKSLELRAAMSMARFCQNQ